VIGWLEEPSERGMMAGDEAQSRRIDELERRVAALEHNAVSREALDEEIRSLELRLREIRELEE
jgi:hypothetical protein